MINSTFKVILKTKFVFCLFLTLTITSCGSFNSNGYTSEDGIYGNKPAKETNQNGLYYKNYFDQKAEEYGLNESNNDSIVTDINSYSSRRTNSSKRMPTQTVMDLGEITRIQSTLNSEIVIFWEHIGLVITVHFI